MPIIRHRNTTMSTKTILVLCVQILLIESITGQCIGTYDDYLGYGASWAAAPLPASYAASVTTAPLTSPWSEYSAAAFTTSNGGGFHTTSSSPVVPSGLFVFSDNAYEGTLAVGGAMPFLGSVNVEGALPTAGAGAVAYGCGNGLVTITAEDIGAASSAGIAGPFGYGAGVVGPLGYGPIPAAIGYGTGCGYSAVYY